MFGRKLLFGEVMLPIWSDSFSVHNQLIDEQHKKLFELAHKAYSAGNKHTTRENIKEILSEFFQYMNVHFADEESYMEEIGYPEIEAHKELHKHIIKELSATIKNIKSINDMKEKLQVVSQEWLLQHILHNDMLIEKYRIVSTLKKQKEEATKKQDEKKTLQENKDKEPDKVVFYECGCKGKIHKLSLILHDNIQKNNKVFMCKACKKPIFLSAHQ